MEERNVSVSDVSAVMDTGDHHCIGVGEGGEPKWTATGFAGGQTVEVVYLEVRQGRWAFLRVITVYVL